MAARVWWNAERGTYWVIDETPGKPRKTWSYHPRKFGRSLEAAKAAAEKTAASINAELAERDQRKRAMARASADAAAPIPPRAALESWLAAKEGSFGIYHERNSRMHVQRYLLKYFEREPQIVDLRRLRMHDVTNFAAWMALSRGPSKKPLALATVESALKRLRTALHWLETDPDLGYTMKLRGMVEQGCAAARGKGAWSRPRQAWRPAEASKLVELSAEQTIGPILFAALHTGARKGELLGLHWTEIDFEDRVFEVHRVLLENNKLKQAPKSKNGVRRVRMSTGLIAKLRQLAREAALRAGRGATGEPGTGRVFLNGDGEPWGYGELDKEWNKLRDRALGLHGVRPFPWHSFRHTYITLALAAGQAPKHVAEQVGDTVATILEHYSHALPGYGIDADFVSASLTDSGPGAHGLLARRAASLEEGEAE